MGGLFGGIFGLFVGVGRLFLTLLIGRRKAKNASGWPLGIVGGIIIGGGWFLLAASVTGAAADQRDPVIVFGAIMGGIIGTLLGAIDYALSE